MWHGRPGLAGRGASDPPPHSPPAPASDRLEPVSRLSVLIPALNEHSTLAAVVDAVAATGCAHEIIVVDDGSSDGSPQVIAELEARYPALVRAVRHPTPRGKGAALRTGLGLATGDLVLIQDADLEYDPNDIAALVAPFRDPGVSVVYGSRNLRRNPRFSFTYYWGGRLLSAVANLLYGARISDESCGYKVVRTELLRALDLRADGFDFCAELTGRVLARGIRIHQVPVSYRPRSFAEGKKVRWRDGAIAIAVLARHWMLAPGEVPRRSLAIAALLALAVLLAYANSFSAAFVFDDHGAILDNPTIRQLWPPGQVLSPPNDGLPVTGRPLTNLSFALNYLVNGRQPAGYHGVNVAIHVICAWLLFGLIRRTLMRRFITTGQPPGEEARLVHRARAAVVPLAFAAALLWAVHPLQTAAVTYISQRAESLATLLILLALYAFVRGADVGSAAAPGRSESVPPTRSALPWFIVSVLACWLAVGVKEIAYAIPLLIALYERAFVRGSWREVWRARPRFYALLFASWLPLAWLILGTDNRGGTWAGAAGYTAWEYARLQCSALTHYLRLVIWPAPLVFDYGRNLPIPEIREIIVPAMAWLAVLAGTLVALRRWPVTAFVAAGFFLILAPTSSFVPIADPLFEHRMYLPSAAVILGLVLAVHRLLGRHSAWLVLPCATVLAALTIDRNADYASPLALWQDTVEKRPNNARARGNLGEVLTALGRPAEALPHFEAAYRLTPQLPLTSHNLANCLDLLGRKEEAIRYYRETLALQPRNFLAKANLANALADTGAVVDAVALYEEVLRDAPDFPAALRGLGRAQLRAGQLTEAIAVFTRAAKQQPDDAEAHFNLGDALARARRWPEAIEALRAAVRLRPAYPEALNNLGNALLLTRQAPEAVAIFQRALELRPDPMTHTNLGLAFLVQRQRDAAVEQFEAALRLDPDYARARQALERARP